ncbi:hypothetical protein [Vibrio sp. WXL103]|uniref:hypothetical protein n=1 Tax=unclassified Vibrio TaxID=2614977 RepID=UPI003EC5A1B6
MNEESMSFEQWYDTFKPLPNPDGLGGMLVDDINILFEVRSIDLLPKTDPRYVWTVIESDSSDEDVWIISQGFRWVNRVGFIVTEVSHRELNVADVVFD